MTYADERAYYKRYEATRRAMCRRTGKCMKCPRRALRGVAANGMKRTHCRRCTDRQARINAESVKRRRRKLREFLRCAA